MVWYQNPLGPLGVNPYLATLERHGFYYFTTMILSLKCSPYLLPKELVVVENQPRESLQKLVLQIDTSLQTPSVAGSSGKHQFSTHLRKDIWISDFNFNIFR